jgi:hypothetical protein
MPCDFGLEARSVDEIEAHQVYDFAKLFGSQPRGRCWEDARIERSA